LPAYDQKLKLAEGYRTSGNLEGALREYRELEQFVGRLRRYNAVDFVTIDFAKTFAEVSEGAAETRYRSAEGYFAGQNYDRAIEEYKAVLGLKSPYKDSLEKISESHYRVASACEGASSYRNAAGVSSGLRHRPL
jgi:tetratricopeptide (TPR) repeat protein